MAEQQGGDERQVIYAYGLEQALADGVLVEVFKQRWGQLTSGKSLVATVAVVEEISQAGMVEIWNAFVRWRGRVSPRLAEADRHFSYQMNGRAVWVIEDGQAFTILYPEDY